MGGNGHMEEVGRVEHVHRHRGEMGPGGTLGVDCHRCVGGGPLLMLRSFRRSPPAMHAGSVLVGVLFVSSSSSFPPPHSVCHRTRTVITKSACNVSQ